MGETEAVMNVGLIGAGNWGKNHLRTFAHMKESRLLMVCDTNPDCLEYAKATAPSAQVTQRSEDVTRHPEIQAVVIAAPAAEHYTLAKDALQAGKNVLVEKPLTLRIDHAVELIDLAREANRTLMVGHLLRYHPAVAKLKTLIDGGDLGDIHYIYTQRVNLGTIRTDENAMWSFAPHDISVILYLLNALPDRVSARGECYINPGVEDVVFMTLHFADGKMANIHLSWLDPHKIRKFTIVGSHKMVTFDDMEASEKIRIYDKGFKKNYDSYGEWVSLRSGDITIPRVDGGEPLRTECLHFLDCAHTGRQPLTDGEDGLNVLRVLEAGQRSLEQSGAPVELAATV